MEGKDSPKGKSRDWGFAYRVNAPSDVVERRRIINITWTLDYLTAIMSVEAGKA